MKKIIFVINNLEIGGVQISLINLLNEIKEKYDVSILFPASGREPSAHRRSPAAGKTQTFSTAAPLPCPSGTPNPRPRRSGI